MVVIAGRNCVVQGRLSFVVLSVHVRPSLHEYRYERVVSTFHGQMESRSAVEVLDLGIGTLFKQDSNEGGRWPCLNGRRRHGVPLLTC